MQDGQWSASKVVATVLWTWTACCGLLVWVSLLLGHDGLMHSFGFTACASSAVSAVMSIKCYTLRLCSLLRTQTAIYGRPEDRVQSIH